MSLMCKVRPPPGLPDATSSAHSVPSRHKWAPSIARLSRIVQWAAPWLLGAVDKYAGGARLRCSVPGGPRGKVRPHGEDVMTTEIRTHAIIGAVVAAVLVTFDVIREDVVGPLMDTLRVQSTSAQFAAAIALVFILTFVLAFAALYVVTLWWERRRPIMLEDLGSDVDGTWIYCVDDVEDPRVSGASILDIKSHASKGFEVSGRYYLKKLDSNNGAFELERAGEFNGEGWHRKGSGIHYWYTGAESRAGEAGQDDGFGCYLFSRHAGQLRMRGAFTGLLLGEQHKPTTREIHEGRRLTPDEQRSLRVNGDLALLNDVIARSSVRKRAYSISGIGDVDGYWMDITYEDDKLVEGGLITIETLSRSGHFSIKGTSYKCVDVMAAVKGNVDLSWLEECGTFSGEGYISRHWQGIYYAYRGDTAEADVGTGYYQFSRDEYSGELEYHGAFMRRSIGLARRAHGKQLSNELSFSERLKHMCAYLDKHAQEPAEAVGGS